MAALTSLRPSARRHNAGRPRQARVQPNSRGPSNGSGARKNPNGPPHHPTLAGHRPECLHSRQYFVERPRRTLTLICECAHGVPCSRICGSRKYKFRKARQRHHHDHQQCQSTVEIPCRFCWFGYDAENVNISLECQVVARFPDSLPRPGCKWICHQIWLNDKLLAPETESSEPIRCRSFVRDLKSLQERSSIVGRVLEGCIRGYCPTVTSRHHPRELFGYRMTPLRFRSLQVTT